MILAIDIGKYKISCAIGTVDKNGFVTIETATMMASKGFENGKVTDHALAVDMVQQIIQKIKRQSSKKITQVWCTVSSLKTTSTWVKATVAVQRGYVGKNDIMRLLDNVWTHLNKTTKNRTEVFYISCPTHI